MTAGHYHFNTTISGHKRVNLVCPGCKQGFTMNPSIFAARKRASKGRPLCCCRACSLGFLRAEREARAAQEGAGHAPRG